MGDSEGGWGLGGRPGDSEGSQGTRSAVEGLGEHSRPEYMDGAARRTAIHRLDTWRGCEGVGEEGDVEEAGKGASGRRGRASREGLWESSRGYSARAGSVESVWSTVEESRVCRGSGVACMVVLSACKDVSNTCEDVLSMTKDGGMFRRTRKGLKTCSPDGNTLLQDLERTSRTL